MTIQPAASSLLPVEGQASVMYSFGRPDEHSNPYVKLLVRAVDDHVEVRYFSWGGLLRQPPDVLHVHWPETMVRGSRRWKTNAKALFGICYLLVRPLLRTKLVWTAHNPSPHEAESFLSGLYCRLVLRTCDRRIVIKAPAAEPDGGRPTSVILHGTFLDWYGPIAQEGEPETPPVRLLFVGLIRRYKGLPVLIRAFRGAGTEFPMTLTVRGAVGDAGLKRDVQEAARNVANLDLSFGHVDDETLTGLIAKANLIVLPYRRLHNSGAALLALSLGRAVLLPAVEAARDLQREFGPEWVYLYEGELSSAVLMEQVRRCAADSRDGSPDMSARQWDDAGKAHVDIYRQLSR